MGEYMENIRLLPVGGQFFKMRVLRAFGTLLLVRVKPAIVSILSYL